MRLQEELVRVYYDHSIFAWHLKSSSSGLLADSPDAFAHSSEVEKMPQSVFIKFSTYDTPKLLKYTLNNLGLEICLPHGKVRDRPGLYIAVIGCYIGQNKDLLCLLLRRHYRGMHSQFFRTRLPLGSLAFASENRPLIDFELSKENTMWIAQPEREWQKANRPLPRGLFTETKSSYETKTKFFRIDFDVMKKDARFVPALEAAYPIPDMTYDLREDAYSWAGVEIETDAGDVWIVSVVFWSPLQNYVTEVKVLLAVINNKLMTHMESNSYSKSDKFQSLIQFYESCKTSPNPPCTLFALDSDSGEAIDFASSSEDGDNIFTVETVSVYDPKYQLKYFKTYLCAVSRSALSHPKQMQEKWRKRETGKSLKELLAQCKPLNAHHHHQAEEKDNYPEDSVIFNIESEFLRNEALVNNTKTVEEFKSEYRFRDQFKGILNDLVHL